MPTLYYDQFERKMKVLRLPPFLGNEAYVPIDGWEEWWGRVSDRYAYCSRYLVVRLREEHDSHRVIHRKDWTGGGEW